MKTAILKALDRALEEADQYNNNVMILLPNTNWIEAYREALADRDDATLYFYHPYPNVYVRYTHAHDSLMSLLVDVLILVGEDTDGWCWKGHRLALERTRASIVRRTINIEVT